MTDETIVLPIRKLRNGEEDFFVAKLLSISGHCYFFTNTVFRYIYTRYSASVMGFLLDNWADVVKKARQTFKTYHPNTFITFLKAYLKGIGNESPIEIQDDFFNDNVFREDFSHVSLGSEPRVLQRLPGGRISQYGLTTSDIEDKYIDATVFVARAYIKDYKEINYYSLCFVCEEEEAIVKTECGHFYCSDCIHEWASICLHQSKIVSCACCRTEVRELRHLQRRVKM